MDIDKELEAIFDDPLLKVSYDEAKLFDIPQDMRRVIAKKKPDYVAQHKLCENFEDYRPLFAMNERSVCLTCLLNWKMNMRNSRTIRHISIAWRRCS